MLYRVETITVTLRLIHRVERRANGVGVHILADGRAVRAIEGTPRTAIDRRLGRVHVKLILTGLADVIEFGDGTSGSRTEISIHASRLDREVNETAEGLILHIELIVVVLHARPVAEKTSRSLEMKILRTQTGIECQRRVAVIPRHGERAMIHDIVEIYPDAKAMRRADQFLQLRLGAPVGRRGARLIQIAKIIWIKQIVADGIHAAAFCGWRQPERVVARLGDLRHFFCHVRPTQVEELEHRLGARGQKSVHQEEEADQGKAHRRANQTRRGVFHNFLG